MHPVKLNLEEIELLKEAKQKNDWRMLPTWKLRYLYQRCVALPRGDIASVKETGGEAKKY